MKIFATALAAGALTLGLSACDVEQTKEGEAPEVDVDAGELPEYDVDAPDVKVGTTEETVEVPDIDVDTEKKKIDVPVVGVEPADAGKPGDGE